MHYPAGSARADDGSIIGAIGVSGSTVEDDQFVAEAGINAVSTPA
tara:strand:- start:924 stop:1058 length:135 start_codon:yes stop_codon:yes gene_type:complete